MLIPPAPELRRMGTTPVEGFGERRPRTEKSCGPDASMVGVKLVVAFRARPGAQGREAASDGDKKARSPGRSRSKPLKPLRAGMPGDPGATVVTNARAFYTTRAAAGAPGTRHSPRPHFFRAVCSAQPGRITPRECGCVFGCSPSSSLRTQGPQRERNCAHRHHRLVLLCESRPTSCPKLKLRRMGPCVRRDDA
jgi:hypothetical protein